MKLYLAYTIALAAGIHAALQVDSECVGIRNGSTFRHESDCSRYYSCRGGKFEAHQCPAGLFWDQPHSLCLPAEVAQCNSGPVLSTIPTTQPMWTMPPTIVTTSSSIAIEIENNLQDTGKYQCPARGVLSIPHQENCSKFVLCFDGTPVEQDCAPGLHFDEESAQCTFPIYAKCHVHERICPLKNDPHKLVFIADKFDCAKYYYCYNGEPHENSCAPGLHWDPVNNWCTIKTESNCENFKPYESIEEPLLTPKTVACGDESAHWIGHPKSCRHYYLCYKGRSMLKRCDDGLLWDSKHGTCNYGLFTDCKH